MLLSTQNNSCEDNFFAYDGLLFEDNHSRSPFSVQLLCVEAVRLQGCVRVR